MPALISRRLLLEDITADDIIAVHELHSLPETDEFNTLGIPENMEVTRALVMEWLARQASLPASNYVLSVRLREEGRFIGLIGMKLSRPRSRSAEVWYKLHKHFWGNGYATEALHALLEFGFSALALHRIEAGCAVGNVASARVMEKAGMQREGRCRKALPIRGRWVDNYSYAILEEDFFNGGHNKVSASGGGNTDL